ncbi:hypothetical protein GCM10009798_43510 [Nocardioides panacihumi]|uniref:Uncharacterized protein n=1 Tax=Nocardioides panacihumi TaxID=400774 RepID=A0ABN2RZ58_9ACTN
MSKRHIDADPTANAALRAVGKDNFLAAEMQRRARAREALDARRSEEIRRRKADGE